jgi:hypothetical protein
MTTITIEIDTDDVDRELDRIRRGMRPMLSDAITDASQMTEWNIRAYAPRGVSGLLDRHIDHERAHPSEDPAWDIEASAGVEPLAVGEERDQHESRDRTLFPEIGTGIYSTKSAAGLIHPRTQARMRFFSRGRWWRLRTVRGQRPQYFTRDAYLDSTFLVPEIVEVGVRRLVKRG